MGMNQARRLIVPGLSGEFEIDIPGASSAEKHPKSPCPGGARRA
jgi:hypothetical protein